MSKRNNNRRTEAIGQKAHTGEVDLPDLLRSIRSAKSSISSTLDQYYAFEESYGLDLRRKMEHRERNAPRKHKVDKVVSAELPVQRKPKKKHVRQQLYWVFIRIASSKTDDHKSKFIKVMIAPKESLDQAKLAEYKQACLNRLLTIENITPFVLEVGDNYNRGNRKPVSRVVFFEYTQDGETSATLTDMLDQCNREKAPALYRKVFSDVDQSTARKRSIALQKELAFEALEVKYAVPAFVTTAAKAATVEAEQ